MNPDAPPSAPASPKPEPGVVAPIPALGLGVEAPNPGAAVGCPIPPLAGGTLPNIPVGALLAKPGPGVGDANVGAFGGLLELGNGAQGAFPGVPVPNPAVPVPGGTADGLGVVLAPPKNPGTGVLVFGPPNVVLVDSPPKEVTGAPKLGADAEDPPKGGAEGFPKVVPDGAGAGVPPPNPG